MKIPLVDLKSQYHSIKSKIDEAVQEVLENGVFLGGDVIDEFEGELERYYGIRHCIGVANGFDALYIVLKKLGIGDGDEVITTAYSWIATANAISQTGAKPVFVDIAEDFNIDCSQIESRITKNTKAILPVHIYGQACDMDEIMKIGLYHELAVIEDSAQAHGSTHGDKKLGTIGKAGILSFYPTKQMGAYGDAGCILTDDGELAGKCREFANHGTINRFNFSDEGINSRMDTLQAAILKVKLKHLDDWIQRRNEIAGHYFEELSDVKGVRPPVVTGRGQHSYYYFPIFSERRDALKQHMYENGVEVGNNYSFILPKTGPYHDGNEYPVAADYASKVITLPVYPELTKEQIQYVCDVINRFGQ